MGTGVIANVLHQVPYPYDARWLRTCGIIFWVLTVVMFLVLNVIFFMRFLLFPETIKAMLIHPQETMFVGAYPIALATIIDMFIFVTIPTWGRWAVGFAWAWFWVCAVLSLMVTLSMPFLL
jgi:tellurite resistance protein TehA-like permease